MARCCGDNCLCKLVAETDPNGDDSIVITGTGSIQDPFLISFAGLRVSDTASIDLTLGFDGSGYALHGSFADTSRLNQLGDVNSPAPLNGQMLAWDDTTSQWIPMTPPLAAPGTPGSVMTGTSLDGDGSPGDPLVVAFDPDGGLADSGSGVGLTSDSQNEMIAHYADESARDTALLIPELNSLCMLDNFPGIVWWYNGVQWDTLVHLIQTQGTEYIQFSGGYLGSPVTIQVFQWSGVTDDTGQFTVWTQPDLVGFNGVLSVWIQPTGDTPWFPVLPQFPDMDVQGFAYIPTSADPQPDLAVSGIVTALLY